MPNRFRSAIDAPRPRPLDPISTPSVTPLLGVLIVLMAAYLSSVPPQKSLDVVLPVERWNTSYPIPASGPGCDSQIVLGYRADGELNINRQRVRLDQLDATLTEIFKERRCKGIYIAAAPDAPYGAVARLVDVAKGAGVTQIVVLPGSPGNDCFYK